MGKKHHLAEVPESASDIIKNHVARDPQYLNLPLDELVDCLAGIALHDLLKGVPLRLIIRNVVTSTTHWSAYQNDKDKRRRGGL